MHRNFVVYVTYWVKALKPKFHFARHVTSRHDTYDGSCVSRASWRPSRTVLVPTWRTTKKQWCTSLVFCPLDLYQSDTTLEKVRWTCSFQSTLLRRPWTRIVRVAPVALVVTSVSRRAVRQARHISSRLVTTFPYSKMHRLDSVSWRDVRSQVEFGLKCDYLAFGYITPFNTFIVVIPLW